MWSRRVTDAGIDSERLYEEYMLLSLHGQTKDALEKNQVGGWEYDVVAPLYKFNMTDIQAAMGIAQMRRYDRILARRRQLIERYNEAWKDRGVQVLNHYGDGSASSGHLYLTRLPGKNREACDQVIVAMMEKGIATNVHYKPLPMLTAYKNLGFCMEAFPHAYAQFENEITLPLHTCLTDEEQEYVIENYLKYC